MSSFFTFYSFKGGVGRSMAMANVADILARRGLRVLAVDFDLEAPGLERYFQVEKTAALANPGLIDLLQSFKKSLSGAAPLDDSAEFRQLERFIFPVYQCPLPNGGELHLLTAGQREPAAQYRQYALAVRTFDWQDFYYNWEGEAFFEWLRGELAQPKSGRAPYDVVLVDSRTGVTEMGGVCAYQLADAIVMLCAANHQNVEGTREVARDFRSDSVRALRRGRNLEMVVVPARIEQRDDALLEKFFQRFDSFFVDEEPAAFGNAGLSFRELTIPYQPEFAFEETVVSDPERREARREIGGAFELLANALTLLARPSERMAAHQEAVLAAIRAHLSQAHPSAAAEDNPDEDAEEEMILPLAPAAMRKAAPATHFDPTLRFAGYDVFLSAGEADQDIAHALADALGREGITVFVDPSALTPGVQIAEATTQALHHSRHLLVCAGGRGVSVWQKREIELARSSNQPIRILPVLLPGADQDIFSLSLRGVADMQVVDLRAWPEDSAAFANLVQILRSNTAWEREVDTSAAPADNPYAGLQAYDEGRVHLIELPPHQVAALKERLRATGLALLVGPTGVGKSSLVSALIAELRVSGLVPGAPLSILRVRLDQPDALARLTVPAEDNQLLVVENWDHLDAALSPPGNAKDSLGLWPAELTCRILDAQPVRAVLLVGHDLPLAAWRQPPSPDAALWLRLTAQTTAVPAPDAATVRRAIETPATRSGFAFEPGLLDRIAQDAGEGPAALPLAQMVLTRLWPLAVRGFLTNASYDACGSIAAVFAAHLEEQLGKVPAELADAVKGLLLRLAAVADDGDLNWQSATWEAIRTQPNLLRNGAAALLWLMEARVLNVWRESPDRLRFSLLQPLAAGSAGQLDKLVAGNHDRLIRRRRVIASLDIWEQRKRAVDALLAGFRLEESRDLLNEWAPELSDDEQAFISHSVRNANLVSGRRRNAMFAVGGLLLLAGAGWWMNIRGTYALEDQSKDLSATKDDLRAATAAIKVAIGKSSGKDERYTLDADLFKGTRIYPQYKDMNDKENVSVLGVTLRALGVQVEAPEWIKDAPTCGEIRYFNGDDEARSKKLAEVTQGLLKDMGFDLHVSVLDLSESNMAKSRPGTLEIWLPPLRSIAHLNLVPDSNRADAAALSLVPGSCANLGSSPAQRHKLAAELGEPYRDFFDQELPRQKRWVDGFLMYRHEVTYEQFARFATDCKPGPAVSCPGVWPPPGKPAGKAHEPARFLGWSMADSYCRWAGGRLPSAEEWEKAASGEDGRLWPWGNEVDPRRFQGAVQSGGRNVADVGRFPAGVSPYGISDMAGNVWELTSSPWPGGSHVMKGGSYLNSLMQSRAAVRWASSDERRGTDYLGFRCVMDLTPAPVSTP